MKDRIKLVRKTAGINQDQFASRLGLTKNYISLLENGQRDPSDRTIADICREFNINETWLRTGEGEMCLPVTRDQAIADFMADILKGEPDFRTKLVSVLARLTEDEWQMLERRARELAAELTPPATQAEEPHGEGINEGTEDIEDTEDDKDIHADLSEVL